MLQMTYTIGQVLLLFHLRQFSRWAKTDLVCAIYNAWVWLSQLLTIAKTESNNVIRDCCFKLSLAVSLLECLANLLPIQKTAKTSNVVLTLASFSSEQDAWTTRESFIKSSAMLEMYSEQARTEDTRSFWFVIETILKEKIKPSFTKARNPAITSAGRKSAYPIPLPRFDVSILDPAAKPWKVHDIYATTVCSWVVSQYRVCVKILSV